MNTCCFLSGATYAHSRHFCHRDKWFCGKHHSPVLVYAVILFHIHDDEQNCAAVQLKQIADRTPKASRKQSMSSTTYGLTFCFCYLFSFEQIKYSLFFFFNCCSFWLQLLVVVFSSPAERIAFAQELSQSYFLYRDRDAHDRGFHCPHFYQFLFPVFDSSSPCQD